MYYIYVICITCNIYIYIYIYVYILNIIYNIYATFNNVDVDIIIRYALLLKRSVIHKQQSDLYQNDKITEPSYQVHRVSCKYALQSSACT